MRAGAGVAAAARTRFCLKGDAVETSRTTRHIELVDTFRLEIRGTPTSCSATYTVNVRAWAFVDEHGLHSGGTCEGPNSFRAADGNALVDVYRAALDRWATLEQEARRLAASE
jgi:hypothetical protein